MQVDKKNIPVVIVSALMFMFAGCTQIEESTNAILNPSSTKQNYTETPKRFQEPDPKNGSVVNSAVELSKKYAELSEEKSALQEKNMGLTTENSLLKEKLSALEPQLEQAKKELTEANDLLIEMRIELNNWKTNIIGFREEMRDADKTQLEALLKILTVLGGEAKDDNSTGQEQDSIAQQQIKQSESEQK